MLFRKEIYTQLQSVWFLKSCNVADLTKTKSIMYEIMYKTTKFLAKFQNRNLICPRKSIYRKKIT